jgi:hypothetical protein
MSQPDLRFRFRPEASDNEASAGVVLLSPKASFRDNPGGPQLAYRDIFNPRPLKTD